MSSRAKRQKSNKKRAAPSAQERPSYRPTPTGELPRFAGVPTLLRLPVVRTLGDVPDVDVLLTGVPFDGGSSYRPGARLAPRAVREASSLARGFSTALGIDIYDELAVADGGDIAVPPADVDDALALIADRASAIVRSGVVSGFVGGDQTVTLGALRGIHRAKLKPVAFLHIDAHPNTAGPAWGHEAHHGSVVRLATEEGLIRPDSTLQLGLRGPFSSAGDLAFSLASGFEIVNVDEVKWDLHAAVSQVRKVVRQGPIYVSVDVAALDPAFAPGVGIPMPGGMNTWELQQILRALVGAEIIGFDVVEICPPFDHQNITALLGVTVLQEILSAIADTRRSARPAPSTRDSARRGGRVSA
ncbi:MAG: arginase family protein [Polyangiaceae bacterium]